MLVGINSRLRKYAYGLVKKRDGEKCRICGRKGNSLTLIVDHIDDNDSHNPRDGSNWQLLCRRHNNPHLKNPGQIERMKRAQAPLDAPESMSAELRKNLRSEPIFQHFVYSYVRKHNAQPFETLVNIGAFKAHCSTITTRRYLKKFSVPKDYAEDDGPPLLRYYDDTAGEDMICLRPGAQWKGEPDFIEDDELEKVTGPSPAS